MRSRSSHRAAQRPSTRSIPGQLSVSGETDVRGRRGAYFVTTTVGLDAYGRTDWSIVADVNRDHVDVINLRRQTRDPECLRTLLEQDVSGNEQRLLSIVSADGRQTGADPIRASTSIQCSFQCDAWRDSPRRLPHSCSRCASTRPKTQRFEPTKGMSRSSSDSVKTLVTLSCWNEPRPP